MINIDKFVQFLQAPVSDYQSLHHFSLTPSFWLKLIEYFKMQYQGNPEPVKAFGIAQFRPYDWFPNVQLNYAQNLLRYAQLTPQALAIEFFHESGFSKSISYQTLFWEAEKLARHFKEDLKIQPGDVISAVMPNAIETVIAMLACTWIGATFSSTSCDFGDSGIADRIGQVNPKVLITVKSYNYGGKVVNIEEKIQRVLSSIPHIIYTDIYQSLNATPGPNPLAFTQVPFNHPLYIMFSSGTTGKPKCIVHATGGVLIQHIKELGLHVDLNENKTISFYTTCGWMMWNWLLSSLFFGAKVVLYEGRPTYPSAQDYLKIIDKAGINIFGTSPKFLKFLEQEGHNYQGQFPTLNTILSTGAPLLPEQFDWVKTHFNPHILLGSISGGTDIMGCFMMCHPHLPVVSGEIQCKALGMDVICANENGEAQIGEVGELLCLKSFPSTPIYFLNDPLESKLHQTYFERYPNRWCHGDYIRISEQGTIRVFGRSDATLNPGGVRIGTAEIYQQTEKIAEIIDSIAFDKEILGETEIWLLVKLQEGIHLDENLSSKIKKLIRQETSARHVPTKIIQISDIPYTQSGKKMEILVSKIFNQHPVSNISAVSNPDCLKNLEKISIKVIDR